MRWTNRAVSGVFTSTCIPLAAGSLLSACGASGVQFSGAERAPIYRPASIVIRDTAPAGLEQVGQVEANCEGVEPGSELDGVLLSDLRCSRDLLIAALQDRAAEVGGVALVRASCSSSDRALSCSADVWGPAAAATQVPAPELPLNVDPLSSRVLGAPPRGEVADAWRIHVEAWPRRAAAGAQSKAAPEATAPDLTGQDPIEELADPLVPRLALGDVRASCAEGCSPSGVREALHAAAAHLGGSSIVGIRCIQTGPGVTCVGSAALLQPEALQPEALQPRDARRSEAR